MCLLLIKGLIRIHYLSPELLNERSGRLLEIKNNVLKNIQYFKSKIYRKYLILVNKIEENYVKERLAKINKNKEFMELIISTSSNKSYIGISKTEDELISYLILNQIFIDKDSKKIIHNILNSLEEDKKIAILFHPAQGIYTLIDKIIEFESIKYPKLIELRKDILNQKKIMNEIMDKFKIIKLNK